MPLFFILAGYSFKNLDHLGFQQFMKNRARARLLPWLFLNAVSAPLWIGWHIATGANIGLRRYLFAPIALLRGDSVYNALLWFIVCLFTVEVIGYIYRHILKPKAASCFLIVVYLIGWIVTRNSAEFSKIFGISGRFWMLHEAIIMYPFYHLGMILKNASFLRTSTDRAALLKMAAAMILLCAITVLTYSLNTFSGPDKVVDIAAFNHGNIFLFPLTAVCGSLAIILVAYLTPFNRPLQLIGQNTLWLLCINGWFYHYFNSPLCGLFVSYATNSFASVMSICAFVSCLSVAVSLLVAPRLSYIFSRYFEQIAIHHYRWLAGKSM